MKMVQIELKEMQNIEKDILKYIDEICKKNNIQYTVDGGTALGAIRHNGFIPWDDDVDIALISSEYDKLIKCLKNDNNTRYKLLDISNETTYPYPFAKVVDSETILKEEGQISINNYGIYVDIFKYFAMPNNPILRFFYYLKIKKYQRYISYYIFENIKANNIFIKKVKMMIKNKAKRIGIKTLLNKLEKQIDKYSFEKSKYCICNWPCGKRKNVIIKTEIFNNGITQHKFEDININIMKEYDKYLTTSYGNYMQFPPKSEQKPPHTAKAHWKKDKV